MRRTLTTLIGTTVACAACGEAIGPIQGEINPTALPLAVVERTMTIGADGGTISLGALSVAFPRGALDAPTELTVTEVEPSVRYRIEPELTFDPSTPPDVTLSVRIDPTHPSLLSAFPVRPPITHSVPGAFVRLDGDPLGGWALTSRIGGDTTLKVGLPRTGELSVARPRQSDNIYFNLDAPDRASSHIDAVASAVFESVDGSVPTARISTVTAIASDNATLASAAEFAWNATLIDGQSTRLLPTLGFECDDGPAIVGAEFTIFDEVASSVVRIELPVECGTRD